MDDTIKEWLREMYDTAIKEAEGTIGNERIWQNGASTADAVRMHEDNIVRNERYIQVLERLKRDVDRM